MRITPVDDNLIQLTRLGFVNAYVVREDDGFTLVDTTMPKTGDALIAAATDAGAPIRRIALTHGHGDHVGSLDELKSQLGAEVPVLMPELDDKAQDLASARSLRALEPALLVVGHGSAVRSPGAQMDRAIALAGG